MFDVSKGLIVRAETGLTDSPDASLPSVHDNFRLATARPTDRTSRVGSDPGKLVTA